MLLIFLAWISPRDKLYFNCLFNLAASIKLSLIPESSMCSFSPLFHLIKSWPVQLLEMLAVITTLLFILGWTPSNWNLCAQVPVYFSTSFNSYLQGSSPSAVICIYVFEYVLLLLLTVYFFAQAVSRNCSMLKLSSCWQACYGMHMEAKEQPAEVTFLFTMRFLYCLLTLFMLFFLFEAITLLILTRLTPV